MFYLDASAAVAAITEEQHSERIWQWLEGLPGQVYCSGWVATEVCSASSVKVRTGALSLEERDTALQSWAQLRLESLAELTIRSDHFETAATFCNQADLGLRGGDALHLAILKSVSMRLLTFDKRMAHAAVRLGIAVEPL